METTPCTIVLGAEYVGPMKQPGDKISCSHQELPDDLLWDTPILLVLDRTQHPTYHCAVYYSMSSLSKLFVDSTSSTCWEAASLDDILLGFSLDIEPPN